LSIECGFEYFESGGDGIGIELQASLLEEIWRLRRLD